MTLHAEVKQYSPKTYQEDYGSIHQTRDAEPERHGRTASDRVKKGRNKNKLYCKIAYMREDNYFCQKITNN